jgi:site-specific recombinase XerD
VVQQLMLVSSNSDWSASSARVLWRTAPEQAFARWLRTQTYSPRRDLPPRPFAADTQETYRALFRLYLRHLDDRQVHLLDASSDHVESFVVSLKGRDETGGASPVTIRRSLKVLERVYGELQQQRLTDGNPVRVVRARHTRDEVVSRNSTVLDGQQQAALIAHVAGLPRDTFEAARRAALLALGVGCGITGEDLLRMKVGQLHLQPPMAYVHMPKTATRPHANIPLPEIFEEVLREYLRQRAAAGATGMLAFPSRPTADVPMCPQSLHRYAVAALEAVGIAERCGAQHVFRASFAVRQLAYKDEVKVQGWMRLHTPKMIERYRPLVVRPGDRPV